MSKERIYRWRWLRGEGLEVMRLERPGDHIRARGEVIDAGAEPYALTYDWELDFTWRTRRLHLQVRGGCHPRAGDRAVRRGLQPTDFDPWAPTPQAS